MSSIDPNRPNVALFYERKQRIDLGRTTPVWSDEKFPTQPLRIMNFGHGVTANGKVSGSSWLMGSRRILGSPDDIMYGLQYSHFQTNTPNIWFALTHSRGTPRAFGGNFAGTIKMWYLAAKGEIETIGNINENILEPVPPGTLRLYALGPGSSKTFSGTASGAGLVFQGVGTKGAVMIGGQLNFQPI